MKKHTGDGMAEHMLNVSAEAMEYVPQKVVQDVMSKWSRTLESSDMSSVEIAVRGAMAMAFSMDIALFIPSAVTKKTALDRLIKSGKLKEKADMDAALLLRDSQFMIVKILRVPEDGSVEAEELATGNTLALSGDGENFSEGEVYAARFYGMAGKHRIYGGKACLDDAGLAVARSFIKEGHGIGNPLRCAEAVYGHMVCHGNPFRETDIQKILEMTAGSDGFPFREADGELHALALKWDRLETVPEPEDAELRIIRENSELDEILGVTDACCVARETGCAVLADAYEKILYIQLETVLRRQLASVRDTEETVETIADIIRRDVAVDAIGEEVLEQFERVCNRVRMAVGSAGAARKGNMAELDKVLSRIQGLRGKTVAQGCTEAEALRAAEKVAELLDRYGLSLSEVEMREQHCLAEKVDTARRQHAALDGCAPAIAAFCDCRSWYETLADGRIRHVFFGLPADVTGARYLYEKIEEAFETETAAFRRGALYQGYDSGTRRSATNSFQLGMKHGICGKLYALREHRSKEMLQTSGRDLVPLKTSVIEDELSALGINLHTVRTGSGRKRVLVGAFAAGEISGSNIALDERLMADVPA